jgi:ubiquinol-cytochrome c reductase cytochrome b subunit
MPEVNNNVNNLSLIRAIITLVAYMNSMSSWESVNHGMDAYPLLQLRQFHAAMPVFGFFVMYAHIARSLMKPCLQGPTMASGMLLLIGGYAVAFLGYAMVYGNMGYWAATVIFSLFEAIPQIVTSLFGDFALGYYATYKLFALHFLLGLAFAGAMILHVLVLHTAGSHVAISTRKMVAFLDTLAKDLSVIMLVSMFVCILIYSSTLYVVHGDNDVYPINFAATPAHIVQEAYLLSVYGALKVVPNMSAGILIAAVLLGSIYTSSQARLTSGVRDPRKSGGPVFAMSWGVATPASAMS